MNKKAFEVTKAKLIAGRAIIKDDRYHKEAFGSWYIIIEATPDIRLVYDGKENWIIIEQKTARVFNGLPVWSEIWIARNPAEADLDSATQKLTEMIQDKNL